MIDVDEIALEAARKIYSINAGRVIGGKPQYVAMIQCAVRDAIEQYARAQGAEPAEKTGRHHHLKTDPDVFAESISGRKPWEIRINDRDFQAGDAVTLYETVATGAEMAKGAELKYTGRTVTGTIDFVLTRPAYGLSDGWCIFSVDTHPPAKPESVPVDVKDLMIAADTLEDYASALGNGDLDGAGHCLPQAVRNMADAINPHKGPKTTAPQAEGDGQNVPDMFWLADNNEEMRGFNEWEFADSVGQDMDEGETKEVRVQLAKSLPDRWMRISVDSEGEAHWGWVKRPQPPAQGGDDE